MAADTVEQIKAKLSIIDVVSPYVKLSKSGRYWRGLSPFNKEKSPSFFVNIERGSYYCFSSSQGGDMFTFIEKMEGVDFKGALKILAEKAGIEIVYERGSSSSANKEKTDRLREAVARAEAMYEKDLIPGGPAHTYALSRGLSEQTIKDWHIGYAPDSWRTVLEKLTADGFTQRELTDAGLIKEADEKKGTWYDRFRNRLMFPIRDSAGRTVGFTGRALDPNDQAKYLNSPETELYKKSEVLFGMDKAKDAIRTRGFAILVEGQMDLLLLHQIGFTNTIALSGTALSSTHLSLIKRYADNLMLALDADRAGLAASMKNAIAALGAGMHVKAVRLPPGKDPADLATEDPKDLTHRVAQAESIVEFFLSVLYASEKDQHHLVMAAERTVLPLIQAIQSPMERDHFISVAARTLALDAGAVRQALARLPKNDARSDAPAAAPSSAPIAPSTAPAAVERGSERYLTRMRAAGASYPESLLAKRLENEYIRMSGAAFPAEPTIPESLVFEAGIAFGEAPDEHAADDLIRAFEKALLSERLARATLAMRQAETARDEAAIALAAAECREAAQRLASFS